MGPSKVVTHAGGEEIWCPDRVSEPKQGEELATYKDCLVQVPESG